MRIFASSIVAIQRYDGGKEVNCYGSVAGVLVVVWRIVEVVMVADPATTTNATGKDVDRAGSTSSG